MMNNIYILRLRTRTRNARTRANADVIQTCGLLQLAVAGRTIRASSKTYLPSVFLLRANLRIPQKRTSAKVASLF